MVLDNTLTQANKTGDDTIDISEQLEMINSNNRQTMPLATSSRSSDVVESNLLRSSSKKRQQYEENRKTHGAATARTLRETGCMPLGSSHEEDAERRERSSNSYRNEIPEDKQYRISIDME
jgi:hypothetical protein